MHAIRVYGKNRKIPGWIHNNKQTYILLVVGKTLKTDNKEMVDHIRKFHVPEQGRGISIKEIPASKPIKSLDMAGMKALADSVGIEYTDDDSRNAIMKRIKVVQNGSIGSR